MADKNLKNTPAWVKLVNARLSRAAPKAEPISDVGRPPRSLPAKKTTVYLTSGDRSAIDFWQKYISELSGRQISIGEVMGMLARAAQDRLNLLGGKEQFQDIEMVLMALIDRAEREPGERP
jgi:hypothetical protein